MQALKVSAKSNPNSIAGALAGVIRERGFAEIQTIGAGALNQAIKAIAVARGFMAPSGIDFALTIPVVARLTVSSSSFLSLNPDVYKKIREVIPNIKIIVMMV